MLLLGHPQTDHLRRRLAGHRQHVVALHGLFDLLEDESTRIVWRHWPPDVLRGEEHGLWPLAHVLVVDAVVGRAGPTVDATDLHQHEPKAERGAQHVDDQLHVDRGRLKLRSVVVSSSLVPDGAEIAVDGASKLATQRTDQGVRRRRHEQRPLLGIYAPLQVADCLPEAVDRNRERLEVSRVGNRLLSPLKEGADVPRGLDGGGHQRRRNVDRKPLRGSRIGGVVQRRTGGGGAKLGDDHGEL